jgi:SAM-dependent methyltransferase
MDHNEEYLETHKLRFETTIKHLKEAGVLRDGINILELGTPNEFTEVLKGECKANITNTCSDLRYAPIMRWGDGENLAEEFDLILCMELIEHIKDQNTNDIGQLACFNGSGIKGLVSECNKLLKQDGALFVSTPNVHCYAIMHNWCVKNEIYTYDLHPRELTEAYLKEVLGEYFDIKIDYFDCWSCHGVERIFMNMAENFLKENGYDTENRDKDNLFALCTKSVN